MATKKQKRLRMQAKHEKYMEQVRTDGLKALRKDRARRFREELKKWQEQHENKHNWKNRPKECPHCQIILKASKKPESESEQVAS